MKYCITFAGGDKPYYDAAIRLMNQASDIGLFDKTILYTAEYLQNDTEFWSRHATFVENNKKGYGYWLWKSYIIKKTMEKMQDGDILLYLDCGCEIDIRRKDYINLYLNIMNTEYIVGVYGSLEVEWTKMDLLKKLDADLSIMFNTHDIYNPYVFQNASTALQFQVCEKTRTLVNEWYELSCDYHNINDEPSILTNHYYFKEHRHDQSIFSLLTKKYNLFSTYNLLCIDIIRNISGISKLQ
jgi:hypothetical protein